MSLKQIAAILWSRKLIAFTLWMICIGTAVVAVRFIPRQFTATAQVLVSLSDTSAPGAAQVSPAVARNYIATQVEAIRSRDTALAVVKAEKLDSDPVWLDTFNDKAGGKGDIADWIAKHLLERVQVARQAASDLLIVTYTSTDPDLASRFANAFADTYMRRSLDIRAKQSQELASWYEGRLTALRQRLTDIERQYSQLRQAAVRRGETESLGAPQPDLSPASNLASARNAVLQARIALDQAATSAVYTGENAELTQLRKQIADIDTALSRELSVLGPQHRRIQGLRANREQLRGQVEVYQKRLREDLIADKRRDLESAERRVRDVLQAVTQEEGSRHQQVASRVEAGSLEREIESLRSQAEALVKGREKFNVEAAATIGSVTVLSRAIAPTEPSAPRVPIILGLAAGFGAAFGIVAGFLREMFDRRVRCPEDLSSYLGIPILVAIRSPRLPRGRFRLSESGRAARERIGSYSVIEGTHLAARHRLGHSSS